MSKPVVLGLTIVATCAMLVVASLGISDLALWNLPPLYLAGLVVLFSADGGSAYWPGYAFALVTVLFIALTHLAVLFDPSSTSALVLLICPFYSLLFGVFGWAAAVVFIRLLGVSKSSQAL